MFTPGPWIVAKDKAFTMVYPLNHPEENICEVLCNMENANLIAAAPELLEACKLLQEALTEHHLRDVKKRYSLCVADAAASNAIAKAEGRS